MGSLNGALRMSVAGLLFLCFSVGWSPSARAACPQPATTVFFVNGINQSEASASLFTKAVAPGRIR